MLQEARSRAIHAGLTVAGAAYRRRLRRYPDLRRLLTEVRTNESLSARASEADCIALYEAIRERRPRHVLEFGPGFSTAAIALALAGKGDFVSIEDSPEWLADHRRNFPGLTGVELIHRPAAAREVNGVRAAFYRDVPPRPYDFIHVDGPSPRLLGADVSCDVIDLLPHLAARCFIIFDGREASARFARPYLEGAGFKTSRHPFTMSYRFAREHLNSCSLELR